MARTENLNLPPLAADTLRNPVILVVDMVNGFVKEGALADAAIAQAAVPIKELIEGTKAPVWFICDNHDLNSREFESFPAHCLKGSKEAEIMDSLKPYSQPERIVFKDCICAFASPDFEKVLKELPDPCDAVITGCCTDLCVEQLALALQSWMNQNHRVGSRVIVPADCVDTYHINQIHEAAPVNEGSLLRMKNNGIWTISEITGIKAQ